jgi:hypothetical protein
MSHFYIYFFFLFWNYMHKRMEILHIN